jgi:hypothetical protein
MNTSSAVTGRRVVRLMAARASSAARGSRCLTVNDFSATMLFAAVSFAAAPWIYAFRLASLRLASLPGSYV